MNVFAVRAPRSIGVVATALAAVVLVVLSNSVAAADSNQSRPDLAKLPAPAPGSFDYAKDIQPILAQHCYSCHGPKKQKSGLRLDRKADALLGGDSGKVIVPGSSIESILIHNVAGLDPDMVMPPEDERLTAGEIAKLRAWIDAGAPWPDESAAGDAPPKASDHWAFKPPQRAASPQVKNASWTRNAVDAFVLARLEQEKIEPSPEADRVTLIRRLTLDLIGLLPAPEETAAFVNDPRPDAYERVVDRLLASPHFGERWGRHWLDLARYADSDGYEKDSPRPYAYLFRDWVIDAINRDLPFDQFTIEQLAGDLIPETPNSSHPTPNLGRLIATGFHRQTLTNKEGGVDKEEFRTKAIVDRVSTTGSTWLGLTVGCAECHTHKFDPITQREFYQLYAFFNNASEKDVPAPQPSELSEYATRRKTWEAKLAELEPAFKVRAESLAGAGVTEWEESLAIPAVRWTVLKPAKVVSADDGDGVALNPARDNSIAPRPRDTLPARFIIEAAANLKGITGFRLEAIEEPGKTVGRGRSGDFALSEFSVMVQTGDSEPRTIELASAKADFSGKYGEAANAIDGRRDTGWSVAPQTNQAHVIVFETKEPLTLPEGSKLIFEIEQTAVGLMNRFRLAASNSATPLEPSAIPDAIVAILRTAREKRTEKQTADLARFFVEQIDDEGRKLRVALAAHLARKPKAPETTAAVMVAEERKTHVHVRGDFLRPGDEVEPATPGVLHAFKPRGEKPDRLDLARWLVDPANPLAGRVAVNHVWQNLFGRAIVTSLDDFGTRGEPPSHPELLDWLAIAFSSRAGASLNDAEERSKSAPLQLGWSRKALIKLIVTSSTYRQSSKTRPELAPRDPNNVLLARQNRFRLEAENIRDVHLAASGLLNPAIGGPSIRPQLPADIAALGYANSVKWQESTGAEQYRRGLYIFFQRTVPYPMLMTFDAPDSNTSCARRERSNTPLQALTLLNDPVFFECARALGKRVALEAAGPDDRIRRAFQLCLSRPPGDAEMQRLRQLYSAQLQLLKKNPDSAAKIAGETDASDLDGRAALVALSRVIMNLDEFLTRD